MQRVQQNADTKDNCWLIRVVSMVYKHYVYVHSSLPKSYAMTECLGKLR